MKQLTLKISNFYSTNKIYFHIFLITIIYYYLFSNILKSGYSGDDNFNAQVSGQLIQEDISLFKRINNEWIGWLTGAGSIRITYYFTIYPLYHWIENIVFIKAFNLLNLILNSIAIYFFIFKLSRNKYLSFISPLIFISFLQYKFWHDPIVGFPSYMFPLILNVLLISLIFFINYLETSSKKYLKYSAILYFYILFMYEISIYFIFLYTTILIFYENKKNFKLNDLKRSITKLKLHGVIFLSHLLITAFFRLLYIPFFRESNSYPFGVPQLSNFYDALGIQFVGSLPGSFWFYVSRFYLNPLEITVSEYIYLIPIFIIIFVGIYKLFSQRFISIKEIKISILLLILGLIFAIPPLILTSLSGHQKELIILGNGYTYIPVYLQYFGNLLIFLSFLNFVKINKYKIFKFSIAILITFIITIFYIINQINNKFVLDSLNNPGRYLIYDASKHDFFKDINSSSMILREFRYPSDYQFNYMKLLNMKITMCDLVDKNNNIDPMFLYTNSEFVWSEVKSFKTNKINLNDSDSLKSCFQRVKKTVGVRAEFNEVNDNQIISLNDLEELKMFLAIYSFFDRNKKEGIYYLINIEKIKIDNQGNILEIKAKTAKTYNSVTKKINVLNVENINLIKSLQYNDELILYEDDPFNF